MRSNRGQIVVELAVLLPLAFFILFILAELCFLFNARQMLFLGSFQAARSYLVMKDKGAAETCLALAASPSSFREKAKDVTYLNIMEDEKKITAQSVFLYRPLFPVLPLARLMNMAFLPERHSGLVEQAVQARTAEEWPGLIQSRVAIVTSVELVK